MIDSSAAYKEVIHKSGRIMSIHDTYTFSDGSKPKVGTGDFMKYSINEATSDNSTFSIGAAVIKKYTAALNNTDGRFEGYDFEGLDIVARVGVQLLDGGIEVIPKGKYRCVNASFKENTIEIEAYDSMIFFDKPYSESTLKYPATILDIVRDACLNCQMTFDAKTIPYSNFVVEKRPDDNNLTFRDVIAYCAQIMCCYARIDKLDQLTFGWYDFSVLERLQKWYDGGNFEDYTSGDNADGGNFKDYSSGDAIDGGNFEELKTFHHLYSLGSQNINTDDVIITGINVKGTDEESNSYLYGEEGYVLSIEENPLIQEKLREVATYIGSRMIGKRFRPLSVSCQSEPCMEAGDCACVTDRKQRTFFTVITNTTFALGSLQTVECTAETPTEKNYTKYNAATKILGKAKNQTERQLGAYDLAVQQLTNLMTQSFGVFKSEEVLEDGSVIYYMHDKPERANSSTIWKMTADAFAVSTDGGKTWNAGMDSQGNAVVNVLNAIGIVADWIRAGTIMDKTGKSYWNLDNGLLHVNGSFTQETSAGIKSLDIENNQVKFYAWNDNGNYVGSVGAIQRDGDGRVGVNLWCDEGDIATIGCRDALTEKIVPVITIDSNTYKDSTPWIRNGANGIMFQGCGDGVEVEHGLIKSWNMPTVSGNPSFISGLSWNGEKITSVTRTTLNISNGLITGWSDETTNY